MLKRTITLICLMLIVLVIPQNAVAAKKFTVAWSVYAGWQPWDYAGGKGGSGILQKWAAKYGIEIELKRMDYIASVEAFVAKQVDACVMTNMETLDMPAASGIDSTVLIVGDYSNGNDALLTRNGVSGKGLAGNEVYLVELSVSHYLLARYLDSIGLDERDVTVVNTSDADIAPVFLANTAQQAVITWNPMVMQIAQAPGVKIIYTSADIPGEIIDSMVVRTDVLQANPELGKALVGTWYEVMKVMSGRGASANKALTFMADSANCSLTEYKGQLRTTAMY